MDVADHRRIGRQLGIFATDEACGAGLPLWLPAGAAVRGEIERFIVDLERRHGYVHVYTPEMAKRETLSTIQVDFYLPGRFELSYQRGPGREQPVMVHRSIVSTMERMVAHLLEVHKGALPVWLAPAQVVVLPVVDDALSHAVHVRDDVRRAGLRVELDDRDATLGARIRDAQQRHVPYIAVVGAREAQYGTVSVRLRTSEQLPAMDVHRFVDLAAEVVTGRLPVLVPERG